MDAEFVTVDPDEEWQVIQRFVAVHQGACSPDCMDCAMLLPVAGRVLCFLAGAAHFFVQCPLDGVLGCSELLVLVFLATWADVVINAAEQHDAQDATICWACAALASHCMSCSALVEQVHCNVHAVFGNCGICGASEDAVYAWEDGEDMYAGMDVAAHFRWPGPEGWLTHGTAGVWGGCSMVVCNNVNLRCTCWLTCHLGPARVLSS